jgi:hypothetical protein
LIAFRALAAELEVTAPDASSHAMYTFTRGNTKIPLLGETGAFRETFVADLASDTLRQRSMVFLSPSSVMVGSAKIDHFRSTTDFASVDPSLPPFIAKVSAHFRGRFFGRDTGEVEQEIVYSNYRRVKCYDDRFEVKIGSPDLVDFLPTSP